MVADNHHGVLQNDRYMPAQPFSISSAESNQTGASWRFHSGAHSDYA